MLFVHNICDASCSTSPHPFLSFSLSLSLSLFHSQVFSDACGETNGAVRPCRRGAHALCKGAYRSKFSTFISLHTHDRSISFSFSFLLLLLLLLPLHTCTVLCCMYPCVTIGDHTMQVEALEASSRQRDRARKLYVNALSAAGADEVELADIVVEAAWWRRRAMRLEALLPIDRLPRTDAATGRLSPTTRGSPRGGGGGGGGGGGVGGRGDNRRVFDWDAAAAKAERLAKGRRSGGRGASAAGSGSSTGSVSPSHVAGKQHPQSSSYSQRLRSFSPHYLKKFGAAAAKRNTPSPQVILSEPHRRDGEDEDAWPRMESGASSRSPLLM